MRPSFVTVPLGLAIGACSTTGTVREHLLKAAVPPGSAPADQSAIATGLRAKGYTRIMIVPPSGTARAAFENQLYVLEGSFLRHGVTVISPAITARVAAREQEGGVETGVTSLSDVERGLILAKKTNAQAILQIGSWKWSSSARLRTFCGDDPAELIECSGPKSGTARYARILKGGNTLVFQGRLIDVESGEVMASLHLQQDSLNNFPMTTLGEAEQFDVEEHVDDCSKRDSHVARACEEAEEKTGTQIVDRVVNVVTQR